MFQPINTGAGNNTGYFNLQTAKNTRVNLPTGQFVSVPANSNFTYTPPQNFFQKISSGVKNFISTIKGTNIDETPGGSGAIRANNKVPGLASPAPYQVSSEDGSMDAVAKKLGIPLDQLVSANGGRKTLPPVGSFIDTQNPELQGTAGYWAQYNANRDTFGEAPPQQTFGGVNQPPAPAGRPDVYPPYAASVQAAQDNARNAAMTSYVQGEKNYASPYDPRSVIGSQTMANQARNQYYTTQALNTAVQTFQLTGTMPSSSQLPGTVDLTTQQQMGFNAEAMMQLGYQFDGSKWVNQGTVAAGGTQRTVNGRQVNWNPATAQTDVYGGQFVQAGATRWVRDASGKLNREVAAGGKWRKSRGGGGGRQETPVAVIADPNNAADTAAMGVQLKQGSG